MTLLATDNDGPGNWGQIMWVGNGDNKAHWADMKFVDHSPPVNPPATSLLGPYPTKEPQAPGYEKVDEKLVEALLQQSEQYESAKLRVVSDVVRVNAATEGEPAKVTLKLATTVNSSHPIYLYKIGEDGKLTYVPSKRSEGVVEAEVTKPGLYGLLEYGRSYSDVSARHWAYDVIRDLSARQIVKGTSAGQFNPADKITRAEFTAMLARAVGLKPVEGSSFADVAVGSWYAGYVAAAQQAGWVKGNAADVFNPNEKITREQIAVMIMRVLGNVSLNEESPSVFKDDSSISSWAGNAVRTAAQLGLLKGKPSGDFMPLDQAARSEGAQVIYNLIIYLEP